MQPASSRPVEFPVKGWRIKVFACMPWVTRLKKPRPCDGIKYSTVALKDIYEWGPRDNPQPPRGIQDKSRCKKLAWWKFRALKKSYAEDGNYCWPHLISAGLFRDTYEETRTKRWWQNNKELIEAAMKGEL